MLSGGEHTRDFGGADRLAGEEDAESLDDVGEFAHVAGPAIARECVDAGLRPLRRRLARPAPVERREVRDERCDVAGALAQRRDHHRDHIDPEEEVLAESSLAHLAREIAIARGEDPHIHLDRLPAAHALDLPRLDRAQQLGLRLRRELADLVEQERAGVRELEPPDPPVGRAGERAPLVTEHLALQEIARDRRAIHPYERLVPAWTLRMDRRGHELLAGAGLAADQHPRVGRSHTRDHLADATQCRTVADELASQAKVGAQRRALAPRLTQLERAREREQHPFGRERLLEEVHCT